MKNIIINEAYDLLRETGIVSNESEFSEDWLGHSDCYLRTLRFKNAEPSMGSLAICGVRLQKAGEEMLSRNRYRQLGKRIMEMSKKCHQHVNEHGVELAFAD
jgi:hypothetical protein